MVDMSIHDVSGVVGWCLGAYSEVENTYVHHLHTFLMTFLHTGSGLYNPLQHTRIVPRPHILYNIYTTLYNTLQHSTVYSSTAVLQSTTSTTPLLAVSLPPAGKRRRLFCFRPAAASSSQSTVDKGGPDCLRVQKRSDADQEKSLDPSRCSHGEGADHMGACGPMRALRARAPS